MPRGTPDGNATKYGYAVKEIDPAAIYQYLWGFSPIDGAGRLVYLDTFNCGLAGVRLTTGGNGNTPVLVTADNYDHHLFVPPNGTLLDPNGTSWDDRSNVVREIYLGQASRIGLEFAFSRTDTTPTMSVFCDYNTLESVPYAGGLMYDNEAGAWKIWNGTAWQSFYEQANVINWMVIQCKIVMDFKTGKYARALIGDQLFDLSEYNLPTSSNSYDGYLTAIFGGRGNNGEATNPNVLGYILITKDEP